MKKTQRLYLYDNKQVNKPKHNNWKAVKVVRGLLVASVVEQIGRIENHGGQNGPEAQQNGAVVVHLEQRECVASERQVAGQAWHQASQPYVLPKVGLWHLGEKVQLKLCFAEIAHNLGDYNL